MKNAALILLVIAGAFVLGLVPVGEPVLDTTCATRILDYRLTVGIRIGVEEITVSQPDSAPVLILASPGEVLP
jgi:hypothetical protein